MSGRYAESRFGEDPILVGIFGAGQTVTIQVTDLSDDSNVALTSAACTQSAQDANLFWWDSANISSKAAEFKQYAYVMSNNETIPRQHRGKFVVGGFPSDSAIRRFEGAVHVDSVNGQAGTSYPTGTPSPSSDRSSNLVDAQAIASAFGLQKYSLHGSYSTAVDHDDWSWEGVEPNDDQITFTAPASTAGSQFERVAIDGTLDGAITALECLFRNTTYGLEGLLRVCGVNGTIQVANLGVLRCLGLASESLIPGSYIDLNGGSFPTIFLAGDLTGNWTLMNVGAGCIVGVVLAGGTLTLANSVTAGTIQMYGYGEVVRGEAGGTITDAVIRGSRLDAAITSRATTEEAARLHGENARTQLSFANAEISTGTRFVPLNAVSHLHVQIKAEGAANWAAPVDDFYVVFNYKALATSSDGTAASTTQTSAPVDGTFTTVDYPS